ncbi:MAG: prolipoprotein diacylglyceryl transferase [Clostridia bacterium]|nr:prolipoprotein diacylglyceryl transferase [Clostridia bacterium]MBQ6183828.1 prolipoprotein diacylglyceryl transferase [Clostridia bacterium]
MIHSFELLGITVYPFTLCALAGAAAFALLAWRFAKRHGETEYIMLKLLIAAYFGVAGALLYDTLFKFIETGRFVFGGISFYGGLIGGAAALYVLCRRDKSSSLTPIEWMDGMTLPFLAFHFCGRIGCFLGGCCYGKTTESFLGVYFPDIPEDNVFHYGQKCLPTQLFEAAAIALCALLLATLLKKRRFVNYLILYPVCRFVIEFWRGDDRGSTGFFLSPSQLVSLLILVIPAVYYIKSCRNNKRSV